MKAFTEAGKLQGYILLEEADRAYVTAFGIDQSLCLLLAGDPNIYGDAGFPIERCIRNNGQILFTGDWCSTTNSIADSDCHDAVRISASFAASGVTINP